jgi:hypothetical protein
MLVWSAVMPKIGAMAGIKDDKEERSLRMGDETGLKGVDLGSDLVVHVRLVSSSRRWKSIYCGARSIKASVIGWQEDLRVDRLDASMNNGSTDGR